MDIKVREEARELRRLGNSYNEITSHFEGKYPRSTVMNWVCDIELNDEARKRLDDRVKELRKKNSKSKEVKDKISKANTGRKLSLETIERIRNASVDRKAFLNMSLAYRKDEVIIRERLEMFVGELNKEYINNYFIDFANSEFLIEFTSDYTRGMSEAIERLCNVGDKRKKILICRLDKLGSRRKKEGIIYYDIEEFWKEEFKI